LRARQRKGWPLFRFLSNPAQTSHNNALRRKPERQAMNHTVTLTTEELNAALEALFAERLNALQNDDLGAYEVATALYNRLDALNTATE
jgi:hypothetical protein